MVEWRAVEGSLGYLVSDEGQVQGPRGLLVQFRDRYGYLKVTVSSEGPRKQKQASVHRLVAIAFLDKPPPERRQVAHGDGNPTNNKLDNLRWASDTENQGDKVIHGTTNRGARSARAVLNEKEVLSIYASLQEGSSATGLARLFGVSQTAVLDIKTRKHWREFLDQHFPLSSNLTTTGGEVA